MDNVEAVEAAGDALYEALRVYQYGPSATPEELGGLTVRAVYIHAFRTAAVYIAEADGPLSRDECTAIDRILWLDPGEVDEALSQQCASDPDILISALTNLCTEARDVDRFERIFHARSGSAVDPLITAADRVFKAVLASDPSNHLDNIRYRRVMGCLRDAVDARPGEGVPSIKDALAGIGSDPCDEAGISPQPAPAPAKAAASSSSLATLMPVPCPANLHDGEICYATSAAVHYQEINVVRNVRYGGLSGRVGLIKGVSFRTGSYNVERTRAPKVERIAAGTLCITDQRLIFLSDAKNLDVAFSRFLSCATGPRQIVITRSNSGRLMYQGLDALAVEVFETLTGTSPAPRLDAESRKGEDLEQVHQGSGIHSVAMAIAATLVVAILGAMLVGVI